MNAYHELEGDDDVEPYLVGKTLGGEDWKTTLKVMLTRSRYPNTNSVSLK